MNENHRSPDVQVPLMASLRNNLGLLADELMRAKIALIRKIGARIEMATTPEELKALRTELSDAILSEDDLMRIENTITKVFEMAKKRAEFLEELSKISTKH
jgi:hypothetical protein